jgi:rod shape determining protein RodA
MNNTHNPFALLDWWSVGFYLALVAFGWLNIYAAVYDPDVPRSLFDLSVSSGKQLLWICLALALALLVLLIFDIKFYFTFAYAIYLVAMCLLLSVLLFGVEIKGSRSWFDVGFMRLQPAEFTKCATALALAKFLHEPLRKVTKPGTYLVCGLILGVPMGLIILQGDTGSALVFSIMVLAMYREGLPDRLMGLGILFISLFVLTLFYPKLYLSAAILLGGGLYVLVATNRRWKKIWPVLLVVGASVSLVFSVDFVVNKILKDHQRARIYAIVKGIDQTNKKGIGYQVWQSKVAIGSGGITGKGFLEGTQTKGNYVPDQATDFIFSIVGEEYGWVGSVGFILVYILFLNRLLIVAERQKSRFSRVYGYCVASILFFHFAFNIAMTMGLFPVIGIPLPFISYGGSSLWAFTVLLFVLLRLDMQRKQQILNF